MTTSSQWKDEIAAYKRTYDSWYTKCNKINKIYLREGTAAVGGYSLFYANISVLEPALYARKPEPVVTRRFDADNPVARVVCEILEKACNQNISDSDMNTFMRSVRKDFLLYGRGTGWIRYDPVKKIEEDSVELVRDEDLTIQNVRTGGDPTSKVYLHPETGEKVEDDQVVLMGDKAFVKESYEVLSTEKVKFDYVNRRDFLHSPARTWEEVWWVGRKVFLSFDELVDRFGEEKAKEVGLDHVPENLKDIDNLNTEQKNKFCKATVYEIWSKRDRKVYFIAESYDGILMEEDPAIELANFWPCPKPLYGTLTNDSLIPTPDYVFYQAQAEQIDKLTKKITVLEKALKVRGFFGSGASKEANEAITKAMRADDTTDIKLTAIPDMSALGGQSGAGITWIPLDAIVMALREAQQMKASLKNEVYEVTGISDIMRGESSNPRETATAQNIKARFGSIRLRDRQSLIAEFAQEVIQMVAEVISEKFSAKTLEDMTGLPLERADDITEEQIRIASSLDQQQLAMFAQTLGITSFDEMKEIFGLKAALELLRNDRMRTFAIEVQTDSMIAIDEEEDRARANEFVGMVMSFIQQVSQAAGPSEAELASEFLMYGVRKYRVGRDLESTLERYIESKKTEAAEAMSNPQPNPGQVQLEVIKAKNEAEVQMMQMKHQYEMQLASLKLEMETIKTQNQLTRESAKTQSVQQKAYIDSQVNQSKAQVAIGQAELKADILAEERTNRQIDQMNRYADNYVFGPIPR